MSRLTYLVLCTVTTIVVMALIGWALKYVVYEVSAWWAVPWIILMGVAAWLFDRHEHKKGTLPPPNGALDRFVWRWLLPKRDITEARRQSDADPHSRLDRPE